MGNSIIPALNTQGLSVGYKGKALLTVPDVSIMPGKVVALIGRNGVGKSTLLRTLIREQKPITGQVYIEGADIESMGRRELARKVAVVTTDRDISSGLLAREIVAMGRHPHTDLLSRFSTEDFEAVEDAMRHTGIMEKAASFFGELSDGERQKVMIARALAQHTPLMILDEPFSFLDTAARIDILALLKQLAAISETAILFSSHDVAQALRMADEMWLLTPEREMLQGTPKQLIADGSITRLFDTESVKFDPQQNDFVSAEN